MIYVIDTSNSAVLTPKSRPLYAVQNNKKKLSVCNGNNSTYCGKLGNQSTNSTTTSFIHRNYSSCGSNYIWNNSNFYLIFVSTQPTPNCHNLLWSIQPLLVSLSLVQTLFALKSCNIYATKKQTYQCFGIISILRSPPQKANTFAQQTKKKNITEKKKFKQIYKRWIVYIYSNGDKDSRCT